jgi:hypothetical protein
LESDCNKFSSFVGSGKHNGQHFTGLFWQKWAGKIHAARIGIVDFDCSECRQLDVVPYNPIIVRFIIVFDQTGVSKSLGYFRK